MGERSVKRVALCFIVAMIWSAASASAEQISMTIRGQMSGVFKGEGGTPMGQGEIAVAALSHQVTSPRDSRSGLPTGKRVHRPLVVTKSLGASSPQIFNALVTNENLPTVVFRFSKRGTRGEELVYYTIRLTNATITNYAIKPAEAEKQAGNSSSPVSEEVTFIYQKIQVESLPGHITAQDDRDSVI